MLFNILTIYKHKDNIMNQDVIPGTGMTITQADLPHLAYGGRLGEYAVVYRVIRSQQGGGFGDQNRHPYAWAVLVYVDGFEARIHSARGSGREWNSLDRLEHWLRSQGFHYWWTRNDLEPAGLGCDAETETVSSETENGFPQPPGK